ncbi:hypothetical protein CPC16_005317 [Podila verticillata]|nr:hypothetical protein BGZ59_006211 [Podila verticillata]KAF9390122.1 hypothetical protein CPC16_005317 [Podila verticillata]KFH70528.1 hypothetical protein MVEG_03378 [Podila verticillata NRRL 6337]
MTQLLESTRNYLRSSTKIGRRLSHRDQSSGSETSLHPSITSTQPSPPSSTGGMEANPRRSSTYTRLSALFTLDNLSKKDTVTSSENHSGVLSSEDKKRKKASRRSTSRLSDNPTLGKKSKGTDLPLLVIQAEQQNKLKPHKQLKHQEVPRGRSPTLSMSHTLHTVASSYDTHPSDYSSVTQYEAHVWRRNLLEESIMHSLRLGWGESPSSHRSRSRSVKRDTRSRKSRDASGIYKNPCPANDDGVQIRNRALLSPNSPYMMQLNPSTSTTNITHSFASFTLELDEHQVPHIMASSVIPNLFRIKGPSPLSSTGEPRGRKDSKARSIVGGHAPSPRVLNGKLPHMDKDRRESSKENQDPRAFVLV